MKNDDKANIVETALYHLKERRQDTDVDRREVRAIDDFLGTVSTPTLAYLYDLIRDHDGGPTTVQLDHETSVLVDQLAGLRAAIANHRLAGLVAAYPELSGDDTAQPASPLVTIRMAVQREIQRLEQVAKDCGLRP